MRIRNKHITVNGNSTLLLTLQCWNFFNRERKPQNKKNKRQDTHVIEKQQRLSASPSPTRPGPSFHRIHSSQGPLGSKRTRKSEKKSRQTPKIGAQIPTSWEVALPVNPPPPLRLNRLARESLRLLTPKLAPEPPPLPEIPDPAPCVAPLSWYPELAPPCVCTAPPPAGKDVARTPPPAPAEQEFAFAFVLEADVVDAAESPGKTPDPDRRAMSARTALSHLISSSSLGAHRRSIRLVVTTLNVCRACPSSGPSGADVESCGEETGGMVIFGLCLWDGKSYSNASRICASGIWR